MTKNSIAEVVFDRAGWRLSSFSWIYRKNLQSPNTERARESKKETYREDREGMRETDRARAREREREREKRERESGKRTPSYHNVCLPFLSLSSELSRLQMFPSTPIPHEADKTFHSRSPRTICRFCLTGKMEIFASLSRSFVQIPNALRIWSRCVKPWVKSSEIYLRICVQNRTVLTDICITNLWESVVLFFLSESEPQFPVFRAIVFSRNKILWYASQKRHLN